MLAPLQRLFGSLTPGVRGVLLLLLAVWGVGLVGDLTRAYSFPKWLGLNGEAVLQGQVWRLVTYSVLSAGLLGLVGAGFLLVMCGPLVERAWSRGEFWSYCLLTAVGTGGIGVLAQSLGATVLGFGGVGYALLVAWARLQGDARMELPGIGPVSVRTLAVLLGLAMCVANAAMAGVASALATASGAAVGWLYLSIRWRWIHSQPASAVECDRGRKLEL